VAGWIGVSALFLDVILALLQKYSHFNGILYTGQQAFYLANMLSWLYLIVIAVIYIAIKASVLVHAWRCPRSYLMMHNKL
jgi:ascorbate-specific PTS system EIIC-type component UlaA